MDRAQLVHFTKQGYQPLSNVGQNSESSFQEQCFVAFHIKTNKILKWGIFAKEKSVWKDYTTLKFLKKKKGRISKNPLDKS